MRSKKETLGYGAVALGNIIFGFSFLFSKLALEITVPEMLIATRFVTAFVILNLIVLFGRLLKKKDGTSLLAFSLKGKPKKEILLLALFQPIIYFAAENYGILYTSSSFAGVIIALIPIVGIVLDRLFFKRAISVNQTVCAVLSVFGVFLTTIGATGMRASVKGTVLLVIAVLAGSLFYVFSKRSSDYYSPLERTYVMFGLGSFVYVIVALIRCRNDYSGLIVHALATPMFWVSIAYLAAVSSVAAFLLLNFGSNYIPVSSATILANLTTVISVLAGLLILHEPFTLPQAIGSLIIFLSVYRATVKG